MTDRLGRLLLVTLEAVRVDADQAVLRALRSWLNSWRGIGDVERGMAHQGYDLQLTRYDERGWRAAFYTTGMEHSRRVRLARRGSRRRGGRFRERHGMPCGGLASMAKPRPEKSKPGPSPHAPPHEGASGR